MNTKKLLSQYILENCLEVSLLEFFEQFKTEFEHEYNLKRFPNKVVRLSEYLMGLPNNIDIPFYYYDIEHLVLKLNPEASERTLQRYRDNFFMIVADILVKEYGKTL